MLARKLAIAYHDLANQNSRPEIEIEKSRGSCFPIQVHESVKALFSIAMETTVGGGNSTLFWTDNWLHGSSIVVIAPCLVAQVSKNRKNKRTIREALSGDQ